MSWASGFMNVQAFSTLLGVVEVATAGSFPALSAIPGQVLIKVKDVALLGISLEALGESWKASELTTV